MESNQLNKTSYLDILFTGKNKQYGAYQLRRDYNNRMRNAIIITVLSVSVLFLLAAFTTGNDNESQDLVLKEVELGEPPPMNEKEPPPPPPPPVEPPPPVKAQVKFTPPKIEEDTKIKVNENPKTEDLKDKVTSNQNVDGNTTDDNFADGVEFKDPPKDIKKDQIEEAPKPEDNKIYDVVAQEAAYPGGTNALLSDVKSNFTYPKIARENGITGRVLVNFVVEKDGSVTNVKVTRGLGYGLDEACISAVKKLKKFTPAKQDGKSVRSYYALPINCSLN